MTAEVHVGFEVGSGDPVSIPVKHMVVCGQTQESGKTTTMESLIRRTELPAVSFVTKRGESAFVDASVLPPYFRERCDWQFVAAILEATMREKMKFERSWIIRASKGANTLKDVQRNVRKMLDSAKRGLERDVCTVLDSYLDIVVPQIDKLPHRELESIPPGVNVMDLCDYSMEMQALVIRSTLQWVYDNAQSTITLVPEAWEFVPQTRGSPVTLAAEQLIRKGGALKNYLWIDSQDIAALHKNVVRSAHVWLLGVQRELNEVKRNLAHVPSSVAKPKAAEIMELGLGEFFVCYGRIVKKVYVQPWWLNSSDAANIARGHNRAADAASMRPTSKRRKAKGVNPMAKSSTKDDSSEVASKLDQLIDTVGRLADAVHVSSEKPRSNRSPEFNHSEKRSGSPSHSHLNGAPHHDWSDTEDELYQRIRDRLIEESPTILRLMTVKPRMEVTKHVQSLEYDANQGIGMVAALIAEGLFDEPNSANAAIAAIKQRGKTPRNQTVYSWCDELTRLGFLTKTKKGNRTSYQKTDGCEVRMAEVSAG